MLIIGGAFGHDSDHGLDHDHDFEMDHDHDFGHDHDFEMDQAHDFSVSHDHAFEHDDHDYYGDSHETAGDGGLRLFSVRGVIAFLAIGGWVGIAVWESSRNEAAAILSAIAAGILAMTFAAMVIKWMLKLQESGNLNPRNAIGLMSTVYIPIPPHRKSSGRVTLTLQQRFIEMDAVTDFSDTLRTGETVQVVGLVGESTLITRPIR
ncbi:MAG: hypothetical protein LBC38_02030 [Oscillospiraceae bacterium]|nr:hypothetical protein [Oscillospiraceae bacterium]